MAQFEHASVIHTSPEQLFDFFIRPKNILKIMPEDFKIELQSPPEKLEWGTEAEVRVTRLGVSLNWAFVVEEFVPNKLFRDRQTVGPFSLFLHTHKFEEHSQGTLLTDLVTYELPFGILGKLAEDLYMSFELRRVFTYRHKRLQELFAEKK